MLILYKEHAAIWKHSIQNSKALRILLQLLIVVPFATVEDTAFIIDEDFLYKLYKFKKKWPSEINLKQILQLQL